MYPSVRVSVDERSVKRLLMSLRLLREELDVAWPAEYLTKMQDYALDRFEANMPERSRALKNSIRSQRSRDKVTIEITAPHALMVEDGVKPHRMPRVGAKLHPPYSFIKEGKVVVKSVIRHPGYKGRHYFKRTVDEVYAYATTLLDDISRKLDHYFYRWGVP